METQFSLLAFASPLFALFAVFACTTCGCRCAPSNPYHPGEFSGWWFPGEVAEISIAINLIRAASRPRCGTAAEIRTTQGRPALARIAGAT